MNTPALNRLRELARSSVLRLQSAGFIALWAGGCVRDILLGRAPKDYDIATNAAPDDVLRLFPGSVAVGKAFGVVRAPLEDAWFEIATFRRDHAYRDGRHPEAVTFADAAGDAARRDFTINALFYDPVDDRVIDYVEGRKDLARRLIRCVGEPDLRFQEDFLRMLRAVRFAATLEFAIEDGTASAIRRLCDRAAGISPERVRDELTRLLLESPRAGNGLMLLDAVGLLDVLLPEVAALKGQAQPAAFHPEGDVFTHTVRMLNLMRAPDPHLAFSALLHDIGKPATAAQAPGDRIRFDRHDAEGAEITARILARLRFPTRDAEAIVHCVRNHMHFLNVQRMRRSTLRRFVGTPTFALEMELHRLDCLASHGSLENYEFLAGFQNELDREPVLPEPWVRGDDLLRLGIPQGPEIGVWRRRAYDAQLEDRFAGREELMQWLKAEIDRRGETQRDAGPGRPRSVRPT